MSGEPERPVDEQASPVKLDVSLCKACGICIELCPTHVFDATEMGEAVVARPGDCTHCLLCELHCPDFAIEVRRKEKKSATGTAQALDEAEESPEDNAGRVYAALASAKSERTAEVTGDQHRCAADHEEN